MKSSIALAVVLFTPGVFAQDAYVVNYSNAPIYMALDDYSRWTGTNVEVVREIAGYKVTITGQADTTQQAAELIREGLATTNVALFPFASNRMVATWIVRPERVSRALSPSWQPEVSTTIADRLRQRREALERMRNTLTNSPVSYSYSTNTPNLTKDERMRKLREYNMELIRAKGAKGPTLPIELTPEEDAQLVNEGLLPPTASRTAPPSADTVEDNPPPQSPEQRQNQIRIYNLDLIRANGAKGQPLPMKLTQEEDDLLVKEGVLPPWKEETRKSLEDETRRLQWEESIWRLRPQNK